jgi:hypothetical protein
MALSSTGAECFRNVLRIPDKKKSTARTPGRQGRKSLKSLFLATLARLAVQNHIHFVRDSK